MINLFHLLWKNLNALKNCRMKNIIVICIAFLIMGCSEEKEIVVDTTDPYLWLEEVEGDDALAWVRSQNEITEARYLNQSHQYLRGTSRRVPIK